MDLCERQCETANIKFLCKAGYNLCRGVIATLEWMEVCRPLVAIVLSGIIVFGILYVN